jgi:hypothetical protein
MGKKYCKVTIDGTFCIYNNLKEALSALEYDIEGFIEQNEEPVSVTFEDVWMTDEEFEALPEFDGY